MRTLLLSILMLIQLVSTAQTNIHTRKQITTDILTGNYTGESGVVVVPQDLAKAIMDKINTDSLLAYLRVLEGFENRNTGSDTLSTTRGIGAARSWIHDRLEQYATENSNGSVVDYLEFDEDICGMGHHKNVLAVHPGTDPTSGIIIIQAHMDSRCEGQCDVDCLAQGMEDNGSGTVLVMELMRVMTQHKYERTIVFMLTTGEEQGLFGAQAMANFCLEREVDIRAVLNNDIVGGILCGEEASPPGCMGLGDVDSTQVRIFSGGTTLSRNKNLVRYTKIQYDQEIRPIASVPMTLTLMAGEDRAGRGGDHIPFGRAGYAAVRFTAANEHGDGAPNDDYIDHQHTTRDILGVDTDGDGAIDSFFVDFNYLKRNAVINGVTAAMIGISPEPPVFTMEQDGGKIEINIESDEDTQHYLVGVHEIGLEFDTIYTVLGADQLTIDAPDDQSFFFATVAVVDEKGVESLFAEEQFLLTTSVEDINVEDPRSYVELMQNRPNPFAEETTISWRVLRPMEYTRAELQIHNGKGQLVRKVGVDLRQGDGSWQFAHDQAGEALYYYSLIVDGQVLATEAMVAAY